MSTRADDLALIERVLTRQVTLKHGDVICSNAELDRLCALARAGLDAAPTVEPLGVCPGCMSTQRTRENCPICGRYVPGPNDTVAAPTIAPVATPAGYAQPWQVGEDTVGPTVAPAVPRKSLEDALVWECERAIKQRDEFLKTGISTASHGGSHDTCFGAILREYGIGTAPAPSPDVAGLCNRLALIAGWFHAGKWEVGPTTMEEAGCTVHEAAAALRTLAGERDKWAEIAGQGVQIEHKIRGDLLRAESALAAANADAARLDWLDRDDISLGFGVDESGGPFVTIVNKTGRLLACTSDIRSAIDAAIAAAQGK